MIHKKLAEAIRAAREQRKLTQEELAERVGVTNVSTIQLWERGKSIPRRKQQRELIKLGVDPILFEEAEKAVEQDPEQSPGHLWHVPRRNPFFTGRDALLSFLHAALTAGTPTALTQTQAMCGLGGIGKTQMAIEYVYHYADEYESIFWIRADPPGLLLADYQALAEFFAVPVPDEADQDSLVRAVLRGLSERHNWLLVLDNVEDFEIVRDILPVAKHGHVLLTTRVQDTGGLAQPVAVETLSPEVGARLLLRRAELLERASIADRELAQRISGVMGGLPLALVQAGAYISASGCDLAGYLDRYEKQRAKLLQRRDELNSDYPESVATTWALSFEKVEQTNPAAADLLRLCAFLDAEAIPEEMIIHGAHQLGALLQRIIDAIEVDDCMRTLLRYSFVQRDAREKTFSVHRLVQAVQMDSMESETGRLWAERAIHVVNQSLPYVEAGTETQQLGQRYIAHAQIACQSIRQRHMVSLEAAQLLNKTGRYLREQAQYEQAETVCQESLHQYETLSKAPQKELAHCCTDLAFISDRLGKHAEAENYYRKALNLYEQRYGTGTRETAAAFNNLALFYLAHGRYTQAEPFLKDALAIREKVDGADSLAAANSRLSLAELYSVREMYVEAEQYYKGVLTLRERMLGPEDPGVGNALYLLAGCYDHQGRFDEAEPLCERAIAIYEHRLGPDHPTVTYPLITLASIYEHQGKYAQAETMYHKALHIREQVLGADHTEVGSVLKGLAVLYQIMGRLQDAYALYQRALAILEKTAGPEHPHLVNALSTLALLCIKLEYDAEADRLIERLLALVAQVRGLEQAKVFIDLIVIGTGYRDRGQDGKARSFYERLLKLAIQEGGSDYPIVSTLQLNLAQVCDSQGDEVAAAIYYLFAFQGINHQRGTQNYSHALKILQSYHAFLQRKNHHEEAARIEAMMEDVRKIFLDGEGEQ